MRELQFVDVVETVLTHAEPSNILRTLVLDVGSDGMVRVARGDSKLGTTCGLLVTGDPPLRLARGDSVLVWLPNADARGIVLGRIGPSNRSDDVAESITAEGASVVPDELVLEARKSLTLKCGDGSVTIRGDGKVLVKGKDLVSRAERTNRIKGGAVAVN